MRVVAVIRAALKDRAEVNRGRAQGFDVIQMLDHATQIPTLVAVRCGLGIPRLEVRRFAHRTGFRKAIREDLIEHGVFDPIWREAHSPQFNKSLEKARVRQTAHHCPAPERGSSLSGRADLSVYL